MPDLQKPLISSTRAKFEGGSRFLIFAEILPTGNPLTDRQNSHNLVPNFSIVAGSFAIIL